jgi:hypothetical protein
VGDEEQKHDDKPPEEPGLEEGGIGPLGLIIGGVTGAATIGVGAGVAMAWDGETLIDLPEAIAETIEANKEALHRSAELSNANEAGHEHGIDDGMNQSSSPLQPGWWVTTGLDREKTHAYDQGYAEGAGKAEEIRASQAGAADGRADAERHQSSAPPAEYAGNPAYEQAYSAAQEAYQGEEG